METATTPPPRPGAPPGHAPRQGPLQLAIDNVDRATLYLSTAVWTLLVVGGYLGQFSFSLAETLAVAYPVVLGSLALLGTTQIQREIRIVAVLSASLALALYVGVRLETSPLIGMSAPVLIATAIFCSRWPAAAVFGVTLFTAIYGSVIAFTGLGTVVFIELILAGLWVSVLVPILAGRHEIGGYQLWPGVIVMLGFLAITAMHIIAAEPMFIGLQSFRLSFFLMITFILVAYAGWPEGTYMRIVKGLLLVSLLAAGYAVLRWLIGPAGAEAEAAELNPYNFVEDRLKTVGSFQTGHQLGFWGSMIAPFALALAIAMRGRWRLIAGATCLLSLVAIFASESRTVLAGGVAAVLVVLALISMARSLRGPRLAVTLIAALAIGGAGTGAFLATAGATDTVDRYVRIFDRDDDVAWNQREYKWAEAYREMEGKPFGLGLGSAGLIQEQGGRTVTAGSVNLDNSYLKIAYEQGWIALAFFVVALLLITLQMTLMGLANRDPMKAGLALGATGTMVAMGIAMYTGNYIEVPPALFGWLILGLGMAGLVRRGRVSDAAREGPPRLND